MLSATIITLNEEKDLPRCLESVKNIADEIVLVDSGSSDHTINIAKKYGAKVYFRKFDNYASQKNFAAEKATGEWIISIDADEEIETQLADEIKSELSDPKYMAYSIPRKNIIFGKLIKHSRWQPELDRHIWLWKKEFGRWEGEVHEEVIVKELVGKLVNAKIHYQYDTITEFMDMVNRYSEIDANQIIKNGAGFNYIKLFGQPIYNFLVRFVYRLGYLDGWRGFVLSYLMAYYHFILWVKIWSKEH